MPTETTASQQTIIHLVHGTWGRGFGLHLRESLSLSRVTRPLAKLFGKSTEPLWFEPGSEFREALTERLDADPELAGTYVFEPFRWSGSNSFTARERAVDEFVAHTERCMTEHAGAKHLVVAHSHGGTVMVDALVRLGEREDIIQRFDGVLTLATPFVTYLRRDNASKRTPAYLFSVPFITCLFVCAIVWFFASGSTAFGWWLSAMMAGILLAVTANVDFRPSGNSTLHAIAAHSRWLPYLAALLIAPYAAWHWLEPLRGAGTVLEGSPISVLGTAVADIFGWLVSCFVSAGSFFIVLVALCAGKQPDDAPYQGILRQFYLALPLFGIAPVLASAAGEAWVSDSGLASSILVYGIAASAVVAAGAVAFLLRTEGFFSEVIHVLSSRFRKTEAPRLHTPLTALRLPRDEAEASIVAAQVSAMLSAMFLQLLLWPTRILFSNLRLVALGLTLGLVHFSATAGWADAEWGWRLGESTLYGLLVSYLGGLAFLIFVGLLYLLVKATSVAFVAVAVGWETLFLDAYGAVECEQLPHVQQSADTELVINWESVRAELDLEEDLEAELPTLEVIRHSIYDYDAARRFISAWLIARMPR